MAVHDNLMSERISVSMINSTEIKNKNFKGSKFKQFIATIAASICVLSSGVMLVWGGPILLMLRKNPVSIENPFVQPISNEEISWIGGFTTVGSMFGCLAPGYLADRWGRRAALLSTAVPFLVSWTLIFLAKRIEVLFLARFIAGLAISFSYALVPMYIGEIAEAPIRGILGSFFQISFNLGLLLPYIIGPFVPYNNYCIICATLPIVFFVVFFAMPETPYYLAAKGRKEDVIKVLVKLRGKSREGVEKEADEIQVAVQEAYSKKATIIDLFKVKANLKALIICCSLAALQQLSGINFFLLYLELIFASVGTNDNISTTLQTIIVALIQLFSSFVNPLVVDCLGRKILLIVSGIGTSLSLAALGFFFYLKESKQNDGSTISWLPISSLIVFMIAYNIGLGPVPWTIMGEMFSQQVKFKATIITIFICRFTSFIIVKYFINVVDAFGMCTAFWSFGVVCFLIIPFAVFILPETKGKSLRKIQDELMSR